MFDTIVTKYVQPKHVDWKSYNELILDFGDDKGPQVYKLLKGAETYLYKNIDIKPGTSKEVYKKSSTIWKNLIECQLEKCADESNLNNIFSLTSDTMLYLVNDMYEIVDVFDFRNKELLEEYKLLHEKFTIEITTVEKTKKFFQEAKGGLNKLVCYDRDIDVVAVENTPVVILELNEQKSKYTIYNGIFRYNTFTFVPHTNYVFETDSLIDFIRHFDIDVLLHDTKQLSEELVGVYETFVKNPVEISVRELTTILKKCGYKLDIDMSDKLVPIENMVDEENNVKIQDYYNTFKYTTGESAFDIMKLSELKKTFRYNKITLLDTLNILSKEYLNSYSSKVTVEVLVDIILRLSSINGSDKSQVDSIKEEVK